MIKTLKNAFADKAIRKKILFTIGMLFVFRIGAFIPLPGLILSKVSQSTASNTLFQVLSTMSGGALSNGTVFALGIVPFINSFIIMQLLTIIIKPLEVLAKEGGEEGRKKITQITRYVAIGLAVLQSIGILISWKEAIQPIFGSKAVTGIVMILLLTAGSTFVMWIGERITDHGVGNGTSLIIFTGIIATAASALLGSFSVMAQKPKYIWQFIAIILFVVLLFFFIVFVDLSERRIAVRYAKQVKGNKMYGGQSTFIPIKVNASGVMPIIFASALIMFPQLIASFWPTSKFYTFYVRYIGAGTWVYGITLSIFIIFFAYFYAQMQFNPQDVAKNLQQYGGMIIGIRPGKPTSDYLAKINNRITLFGALFLSIIALIPSVIFNLLGKDIGLVNAFSATSLLIVVSVAMEFNTQLEQQLMMKHYKGFLK